MLYYRGYLGPGGLAEGGSYSNCTGGAAGYIDRVIFGEAHIYQTPTCRVSIVYLSPFIDIHNSCLLAFLMVYFGRLLQMLWTLITQLPIAPIGAV